MLGSALTFLLIFVGKRKKGSAVDRAIGQSEILDGTGFWKDFIRFLAQ